MIPQRCFGGPAFFVMSDLSVLAWQELLFQYLIDGAAMMVPGEI